MEFLAWIGLFVLATGVLVAISESALGWLRDTGSSWIASFFRGDPHSERGDGHHPAHG